MPDREVFSKSPEEFADAMRLAVAMHWYSQGLISQGKAAEIAGLDRARSLDELFRRKVPAIQITLEELREELGRGSENPSSSAPHR